MSKDSYEFARGGHSANSTKELQVMLEMQQFRVFSLDPIPAAKDGIRWRARVEAFDGRPMLIEGHSFISACVNSGMEMTRKSGDTWEARANGTSRGIATFDPSGIIYEWPKETIGARAFRVTDFLRANGLMTDIELKKVNARIPTGGKVRR